MDNPGTTEKLIISLCAGVKEKLLDYLAFAVRNACLATSMSIALLWTPHPEMETSVSV